MRMKKVHARDFFPGKVREREVAPHLTAGPDVFDVQPNSVLAREFPHFAFVVESPAVVGANRPHDPFADRRTPTLADSLLIRVAKFVVIAAELIARVWTCKKTLFVINI